MYTYKDPNTTVGAGGVTQGQRDQTGKPQSRLSSEEGARADAKAEQQKNAILRGYSTLARTSGGVKSKISKDLEGATLKIGTGGEWTVDTGIAWTNKKSLVSAIAFGDQIGDSWRGIKQLMQENGWADDLIDVQSQDQNEKLMRLLYDDDEFQNAAYVGGGAGMVAEPIGLLVPFGKAATIGKTFMKGAALGGLYGSSLYIDENESRLNNAAITAGLMGPMGAIAAKYFSHTVGSEVAGKIFNATDDEVAAATARVTDEATTEIARRSTPEYQGAAAKVEAEALSGMDAEVARRGTSEYKTATTKAEGEFATRYDAAQVARATAEKKVNKEARRAIRKAGGKVKKQRKTPAEKQIDVEDGLEVRASVEGKRHAKVNTYRAAVDAVLQPLYDNVRKYSSKVAHGLRTADGKQHRMAHVWSKTAEPWMRFQKGLNDVNKVALKKALANGGFSKATMSLIHSMGGSEAVAYAKNVTRTLDEIRDLYKGVGYNIGKISNYHPMSVKDLEGLLGSESMKSSIDKALRSAQAKSKTPLTAQQKAHVAEHTLSFKQRYSQTSGSQKKRLKQEVSDDDLAFYHDPNEALHFYIQTAAEDIAKREFFKSFGHKAGKKGLDTSGADIDASIGSLIERIKADVPGFKEQQEVTNLLRSRFSADVHKTHGFVQGIKNLSYAGTLGNYWSAMTQIGDLVFAFHKYGIKAAAGAMFGPRVTDKAALGIEKAMQELTSAPGKTDKIAEWAFRWSGFNKIDAFGKNVNINAALRANKSMALKNPKKFIEKYVDKFGQAETEKLVMELQHMKLTKNNEGLSENMYLMLWNELADTQPIGLSEMPKKYLDMPNGRILYAYKTFALKQMNYMRNIINSDKNAFRKGANLAYFGSMFVLANGSIDGAKDFMSGKDLHMEDKFVDNFLGLMGTSKYAVDKSQGLGGILSQIVQPVPIVQAGKALDNLTGSRLSWGETGDSVLNQLPLGGKMKKEWMDK